jgi:hypothetical protein
VVEAIGTCPDSPGLLVYPLKTSLISMNLYKGILLVNKSGKPDLSQVVGKKDGTYEIEFESDGSLHDYWSLEEINDLFEECVLPMILYCWTGKSRFCINYEAGYYYVTENETRFLGRHMDGDCQADYQRLYKLKAFW